MLPPPRPLHAAHDPRRRRRRDSWAVPAALVLTASLALTACTGSGGGDPSPGPTATDVVATPSPTPTPSPTRSPQPERPSAMDEVSADGALAVAAYVMSLYSYVYNTGDLAEWNTLSHPECLFCANVADNVEELFGKGHHNEGGRVTITGSTALEIDPGRSFSAELEVTQESFSAVDRSGVQVGDPVPADSFKVVFSLFFEEGAWLVRGVESVASDA